MKVLIMCLTLNLLFLDSSFGNELSFKNQSQYVVTRANKDQKNLEKYFLKSKTIKSSAIQNTKNNQFRTQTANEKIKVLRKGYPIVAKSS